MLGRFMGRDGFVGFCTFPLALSRYAQVLENSISAVDPSGLPASQATANAMMANDGAGD